MESDQFRAFATISSYRLGQAFHNFAHLNKVTNSDDKEWCDKLWNESDTEKSLDMLYSRMDYKN
jgi:hypothetical protein